MHFIKILSVIVLIISICLMMFFHSYLYSSSFRKVLNFNHLSIFTNDSARIYLKIAASLFICSFLILAGIHLNNKIYANNLYSRCQGVYKSSGNFSRVIFSKHYLSTIQDNNDSNSSRQGFSFQIDKIKKNGSYDGIILYGHYLVNHCSFNNSKDETILVGITNHNKTLELNSYGDNSQPGNPHFDTFNCQHKIYKSTKGF